MRNFISLTAVLLALTATGAAFAQPEFVQPDFVQPELTLPDELAAKRATSPHPIKDVYIVQLKAAPAVAYQGGILGLAATAPATGKKIATKSAAVKAYVAHLDRQHDEVLRTAGARERKIYSYRYTFNGFSAYLTKEQLAQVASHPDVVRIWQNELRQPQTNSTPDFLGLTLFSGPWRRDGATGEDIIIGSIDSGIWPEHDSFADVSTRRLGVRGPKVPYGDPPAHWQGSDCVFGNQAFNPGDAAFDCNNKLLGANFYVAAFSNPGTTDAAFLLPEEYLSARDQDGHGSHTAATAGGNSGVEASIDGLGDLGIVSGVAPRARIASYKICWNGSNPPDGFFGGCGTNDAMAAIDQAVADGVDVINYSIGGSSTAFTGADDFAFLFAADAGVFVATSAGNSGPGPQTVGTPAAVPWVTAVAATQDDEVEADGLQVDAPAEVAGVIEARENVFAPQLSATGPVSGNLVVSDPVDACTEVMPIGGVALVMRGGCNFDLKFANAQAAGASAIVVYNNVPGAPFPMAGDATGIDIPGLMIALDAGTELAGTPGVSVTLDDAVKISKEDTMAIFSSRGPNGGAFDIIKPDIAAPGVSILAAQTPTPNDGQTPDQLFQIISGTSMASPHIAGVGALIKQAKPDWTPAMIRSAMMTTARQDILTNFGDQPTTPFDIGAGFVRPSNAFRPGLVFDADLIDYTRFLCGLEEQPGLVDDGTCLLTGAGDSSDLNLPSIGINELVGEQTVRREVTSVFRPTPKDFVVRIEEPPGVRVNVSPRRLTLSRGEEQDLEITFTARPNATFDEWAYGSLTWFRPFRRVRIPLAVKPTAIAAPSSVSFTDANTSGFGTFDVQFGYNGPYSATPAGLVAAETMDGAVANGDAELHFIDVPEGTRIARFSLFDEFVGDGTGNDDLDLVVQGPDSEGFPTVGFSGSFTSEEQVELRDPAPGTYAVFVVHFASQQDPTPYTLFDWVVGGDEGNLTINATDTAAITETATIDLIWENLEAATKYLGLVLHSNAESVLKETLVEIETE